MSDPNIPTLQEIRILDPLAFGSGPFDNLALGEAFAFADFFQDGTYSAIVNMVHHNPALGYYDVPAKLFFLRKTAAGHWVESTTGILSDETGCIHPRKAIVADFNADGKPDIFFACHGIDTPPFPGEAQRILLSQTDGTYTNAVVPFVRFTHGGSAADLNGDGKPDLVLTWTNAEPNSIPYVLINVGDGTFVEDLSRLPTTLNAKAIYSAELIDTENSGHHDLLLGGAPPDATGAPVVNPGAFPNGLFKNDGDGHFLTTPYVAFPNPAGSTGIRYSLALDFIFLNGFIYVSQVDLGNNNVAVQKVKRSDLSVTTAYEHLGTYSAPPIGCAWFPWIYPTTDGQIVSQSASVNTPLDPQSCQGVSFPQ